MIGGLEPFDFYAITIFLAVLIAVVVIKIAGYGQQDDDEKPDDCPESLTLIAEYHPRHRKGQKSESHCHYGDSGSKSNEQERVEQAG